VIDFGERHMARVPLACDGLRGRLPPPAGQLGLVAPADAP
jgi:hypothetical protein